jgi:hypothetical protein
MPAMSRRKRLSRSAMPLFCALFPRGRVGRSRKGSPAISLDPMFLICSKSAFFRKESRRDGRGWCLTLKFFDPAPSGSTQSSPWEAMAVLWGKDMSKPLGKSSTEAYIFAAIGIAAVVIPMGWQLRSILDVILAAIIVDLIFRSPQTIRWPRRTKLFSVVVAMVFLVGATWRQIADDYRGDDPADLSVTFAYPKAPALLISNESEKTANDVAVNFAVWNLTKSSLPLPIVTNKQDFIHARTRTGPFTVFENQNLPTSNDRIFGLVVASCRNCVGEKTYWLNVTWGKDGWVSKISPGTGVDLKKLTELMKMVHDDRNNIDADLSALIQKVAPGGREAFLEDPWRP